MNVELRELRSLLAILDEGSFTDAAIALGVSQAAVSRSLARLERELGTPLVRRTTRRVELTPQGVAFAANARRLLSDLDRAVAEVRGDVGTIRLGYAWAALGAHTTSVIRAWNRRHPTAHLRMVHANDRDVGLRLGRCDVAVVRHPLDGDDLEQVVVGREARRAAVAVDHPLADARTVRLAELVPYVVGVDRATGSTTPELWRAGDAAAAAPTISYTSDIDEWLDVIAAGELIGVTAEGTEHHRPHPGVVFLPIDDAPGIDVRLVWLRRHPHPLTGRLARHLTAAFAGDPADVGGPT